MQALIARLVWPSQLAAIVFAASAISWLMPDAITAMVVAGVGAVATVYMALRRPLPAAPPPPAPAEPEPEKELTWREVRHEIRNALSPVLLVADRMTMSDDPEKRRAGDIIAAGVERTNELLRKHEPA
jgi:hypothetical protein